MRLTFVVKRPWRLIPLSLVLVLANASLAETGKKTYDNGGVYVGELENGFQNGKGRYTAPDGYIYEGEWQNGSISGYGRAVFPDGSEYTGEFLGGLPQGRGRMTMADGSILVGECADLKIYPANRGAVWYRAELNAPAGVSPPRSRSGPAVDGPAGRHELLSADGSRHFR